MRRHRLIAVVDDEASVRAMLCRLLRLEGYAVVSFGCGEDFIASLAQGSPDCAVLDIQMPKLTGFEVQARLEAICAAIPVVFITASDDPALDQKAAEARAVALLRKPFSSQELSCAVEAALATRSGGAS